MAIRVAIEPQRRRITPFDTRGSIGYILKLSRVPAVELPGAETLERVILLQVPVPWS